MWQAYPSSRLAVFFCDPLGTLLLEVLTTDLPMDQVEYDSIYKWLLEVDKDAVGQHVGTIGANAL